jgi:V/A-type H+-transporting ATPase subunit E
MSGLDHLTAKIREDAKTRASEITGAAEAQAKSLVEEAVADATREKERILTNAQAEAKQAAEQLIIGKTLAIRDQNLDAKQKMLDQVFQTALERLAAMSDAEYEKFVLAYLTALDPDGDEIVLPANRPVTVASLNLALKAAGKKGGLISAGDGRTVADGFILAKNGIEQNYTFASLVSFYRYELESEVLRLLY